MMNSPVLVAAPTVDVVPLGDLKDHLRVDTVDEDDFIASLGAAAVSYLDGWRGILGRAIMPQTWSQEFTGWGCLRLSLPDVQSATVVGYLDGAEVAPDTQSLRLDGRGPYVTATGGAVDKVVVTYDVALPVEQLPSVQMAVKLLVGHWYENREAVTANNLSAAPMAVNALLSPLRTIRI